MFSSYFDGYCPACLLVDQTVSMRLNRFDLFECPDCHLQVVFAAGSRVAIVRRRGEGLFRGATSARHRADGALLCRENPKESYEPDGYNGFDTEAALRDYIRGIPPLKEE